MFRGPGRRLRDRPGRVLKGTVHPSWGVVEKAWADCPKEAGARHGGSLSVRLEAAQEASRKAWLSGTAEDGGSPHPLVCFQPPVSPTATPLNRPGATAQQPLPASLLLCPWAIKVRAGREGENCSGALPLGKTSMLTFPGAASVKMGSMVQVGSVLGRPAITAEIREQ